MLVDAVSAVLDGHSAAAFSVGDYGDGFAGITAKGEQKSIELFVLGFDLPDDVFFSFNGFEQRHFRHRLSFTEFLLAAANRRIKELLAVANCNYYAEFCAICQPFFRKFLKKASFFKEDMLYCF